MLDFYYVANAIRGLTKDPDILEERWVKSLVAIVERLDQTDIYVKWPITTEVRRAYIQALEGLYDKIFHDYKKRFWQPPSVLE